MSDAPLTGFLCPRRLPNFFHLLQKHILALQCTMHVTAGKFNYVRCITTSCKQCTWLHWLLSYALPDIQAFFWHLLQKQGTAVKFNWLLFHALADILASCTSCKNTPLRAMQGSMQCQLCIYSQIYHNLLWYIIAQFVNATLMMMMTIIIVLVCSYRCCGDIDLLLLSILYNYEIKMESWDINELNKGCLLDFSMRYKMVL